MKCFTAVLTLLCFFATLNGSLTADEIAPIGIYQGKHADSARQSAIPQSKIINDQQSLEQVLSALQAPNLIPNPVDWNAEIVLVDSVRGPNRMTPQKMILANGDLSFSCRSTLVGGAGFGYVFVRIPKRGIQKVNGIAVPGVAGPQTAGDSKVIADNGVGVEMVGTLKTGITAIGGETTGTIITADNITFEIDTTFGFGLRQAVQQANNKRARVKGRLVKKAGVEIKERWIIRASSIESIE